MQINIEKKDAAYKAALNLVYKKEVNLILV
jgi:hypothetical protein